MSCVVQGQERGRWFGRGSSSRSNVGQRRALGQAAARVAEPGGRRPGGSDPRRRMSTQPQSQTMTASSWPRRRPSAAVADRMRADGLRSVLSEPTHRGAAGVPAQPTRAGGCDRRKRAPAHVDQLGGQASAGADGRATSRTGDDGVLGQLAAHTSGVALACSARRRCDATLDGHLRSPSDRRRTWYSSVLSKDHLSRLSMAVRSLLPFALCLEMA